MASYLFRTVSAWLYFLPWFLQAYEKQKQAQRSSNQLESKSEERERVERFKTKENSIVSKPINPFTSGACMCVKMYFTMLATRGSHSSDSIPQTLRYGWCCRHLCCFKAPKLFLRHFYNEYNSVKTVFFFVCLFFQVRTLEVRRTGHRAALENYPVLPQLQVPARACPVFGFPHWHQRPSPLLSRNQWVTDDVSHAEEGVELHCMLGFFAFFKQTSERETGTPFR